MTSKSLEKTQDKIADLQETERDFGQEKDNADEQIQKLQKYLQDATHEKENAKTRELADFYSHIEEINKKEIERLQKLSQNIQDEGDSVETKKLADAYSLVEEIEKNAKIPNHEIIKDIYRLSKNPDALKICTELTEKAFEDLEIENLDISDRKKVRYLENVADIRNIETTEQPQIFIKPIQKEEKSFWGTSYKPKRFGFTDEVLVVVRLNNGETPDENTFVEVVAKTEIKDGKVTLKMGKEDKLLSRIETEKEYTQGIDSGNGIDNIARRGGLTYDGYAEGYKKEHKESLINYHKRRDKNLEINPEYTASKQEREEFIESISERYTAQLEAAQQIREEIFNKAKERLDKQRMDQEELFNSATFLTLMGMVNNFMIEDSKLIAANEKPIHARSIESLISSTRKLYPDHGDALIERFFRF